MYSSQAFYTPQSQTNSDELNPAPVFPLPRLLNEGASSSFEYYVPQQFASNIMPETQETEEGEDDRSNFEDYEKYVNLARKLLESINLENYKKMIFQTTYTEILNQMRIKIAMELDDISLIERLIKHNAECQRKEAREYSKTAREISVRCEKENLHESRQLWFVNNKRKCANYLNLRIARLMSSVSRATEYSTSAKFENSHKYRINALRLSLEFLKYEYPILLYIDSFTNHYIAVNDSFYYVHSSEGLVFRFEISKIGRPILGLHYTVTAKQKTNPYRFTPREIHHPWGVCCDRNGIIYLGNDKTRGISKFKIDGTFIETIQLLNHKGVKLSRPTGLAVDILGGLVVVDQDDHSVLIFEADGTLLTKFGARGLQNGQLRFPWDVAINMKGEIVVADTKNKRIQIFDRTGNFIGMFWLGEIIQPRRVCLSPNGFIYVIDARYLIVIVISPDLKYFRNIELGTYQIRQVQDILCDDYDNIIVLDYQTQQIKAINSTGELLFTIYGNTKIPEVEPPLRPSGICLTTDGRILHIDYKNNYIQIFFKTFKLPI